MCDISRPAAARGVRAAARGRAWTRRRAPPPRCCTTACASASARTSCRWRAGWRSSRPRTRAGLRSTVTVMFGHIEEPWELAEHMRVVRELQERTRRVHRVRAAVVHPVPHAARPHARDRGDLAARRTSSTPPSSASRWAARIRNLQASWVKMGLETATEALRWGVNDLGGTLMEESISRLAGTYHGVRLDPHELIAAAHAPAAPRPSARRCTSCAGATSCRSRRRRARPRTAPDGGDEGGAEGVGTDIGGTAATRGKGGGGVDSGRYTAGYLPHPTSDRSPPSPAIHRASGAGPFASLARPPFIARAALDRSPP